jgi:hypothetical protein
MVRIPFGRYLSRGSGWGDMFPLRVGAGHPPVVAPQLGGGGRLAAKDADDAALEVESLKAVLALDHDAEGASAISDGY